MTSTALPEPSRMVPEVAGVTRASELTRLTPATGIDRMLPVPPVLHPVLPGLRRGDTLAVTGASSLVLALLSKASADGAWCVVVGMPGFGGLAAAQAGVALERLALVPHPGVEWPTVVATLLDGVDVVVVAPPGPVADPVRRRLSARARHRGSVLVAHGRWSGTDLTLTAEHGAWEGLGTGHGRLRRRELTVTARGRGAATRPRRVRVSLPDPAGRLAAAPPVRRPTLTVLEGGAA